MSRDIGNRPDPQGSGLLRSRIASAVRPAPGARRSHEQVIRALALHTSHVSVSGWRVPASERVGEWLSGVTGGRR